MIGPLRAPRILGYGTGVAPTSPPSPLRTIWRDSRVVEAPLEEFRGRSVSGLWHPEPRRGVFRDVFVEVSSERTLADANPRYASFGRDFDDSPLEQAIMGAAQQQLVLRVET